HVVICEVDLRSGWWSVPAQRVEREEELVVEVIDVGAGRPLAQRQRRGPAAAIEEYLARKRIRRTRAGIMVPRAEVGCTGERLPGVVAGVAPPHRLAVEAQPVLHEAGREAVVEMLEVRVAVGGAVV